jgi:peroxiredoxin
LKALNRCGWAAMALLCLMQAACSSSAGPAAASSVKPLKDRMVAPDFALKDVDGRTVRLSEYRGKVVLLNFWATWCGPCTIEIPWLMEFEQKNKERGFAVLGVSMDEGGWNVIKPFVAEMRVNYRVLKGDDMIAEQYGGVESLPTSFLIDRQGRIASAHLGLVSNSRSIYQNEIQELLSEPNLSGLPAVPGVAGSVVGAR